MENKWCREWHNIPSNEYFWILGRSADAKEPMVFPALLLGKQLLSFPRNNLVKAFAWLPMKLPNIPDERDIFKSYPGSVTKETKSSLERINEFLNSSQYKNLCLRPEGKPTTKEICKMLGISRSTFERNISKLNDETSTPIKESHQHNPYRWQDWRRTEIKELARGHFLWALYQDENYMIRICPSILQKNNYSLFTLNPDDKNRLIAIRINRRVPIVPEKMRLESTEKRIREYIKSHSDYSSAGIAKDLDISQRTVQRYLKVIIKDQ